MSLLAETLAPPTGVMCASCGKPASVPVARHGKWTYLACTGCQSLELCPVPTEAELQRYYNSEYSVPCNAAYYRHYEGVARELLGVIERNSTNHGTLLEIGCSHGAFLLPALAAGWEVTGIEISAEAASNARARGLRVVTGTLEQCGSSLGTFDCIVAWYVIEHLVDVDSFLDNIRQHLKPGGLLALRTANARALVARTIPQYWQWIDAPAHIRLFSPAGMAQLLARHGFCEVRQSTRRGDARTLGTDLLMAAAKTVVDRKAPREGTLTFKGNGSRAGNLTRYTDLVFKPVDWILGIDGRNLMGAELFAVAKNGV
jgi:SAM-dependent methyltransferase